MTEGPWSRDPEPDGPDAGPGGRRLLVLVAALAALAVLIYILFEQFPGTVSGHGDMAYLVYLLILAVVIGSGLILGRDIALGKAVKTILAWGGIGIVLVLGYSFRDRLMGELSPDTGLRTGQRSLTFRASDNGHFYVWARIGQVRLRFLVDTGAADVTLSQDDARRLGLDVKKLAYTRIYSTANGTVTGAPVKLKEMKVGGLVMRDVAASVNGGRMRGSLLGMTFLSRLKSYEVKGSTLTLRW